jgi:hypothetical protein
MITTIVSATNDVEKHFKTRAENRIENRCRLNGPAQFFIEAATVTTHSWFLFLY